MYVHVISSIAQADYDLSCIIVCDDCNTFYLGDCPIHGPLKLLDDTAGLDEASLTYTQLPVPCPLTVRTSSIKGAGLGVFTNQLIPKGVRMGPYKGRIVDEHDMGDLQDTTYTWEVSSSFSCSHLS